MPSRSVKSHSDSLRAGMSTMIAAKRQSELISRPSVHWAAWRSQGPEGGTQLLRRPAGAKIRGFALAQSRSRGFRNTVRLGFFWIGDYDAPATMVSEPARPARWPPSRHGDGMRLLALVDLPDHVCCRYRIPGFEPALMQAGWSLTCQSMDRGTLSRINQLTQAGL